MSVQMKVKDVIWVYQQFFDLVVENWNNMSLPAIAKELTKLTRDKSIVYTSLNYRMVMLTDGVQLDLLDSSLIPVVCGRVVMDMKTTSATFTLSIESYSNGVLVYVVTKPVYGMVSPYYINHWMDNLSGVL